LGDLAFNLMRKYLPELSDMLFRMMRFAYGVRPGNALRFEAELVAAAGLAAEGDELSLETLRAQGLWDSCSVCAGRTSW
jgi:hypothetical protein